MGDVRERGHSGRQRHVGGRAVAPVDHHDMGVAGHRGGQGSRQRRHSPLGDLVRAQIDRQRHAVGATTETLAVAVARSSGSKASFTETVTVYGVPAR